MRRVALFVLLLFGSALAGCSDDPGPQETNQSQEFQEDLGVQATETKGVLLGVVVDEAIRPLKDAAVAMDVGGELQEKTTDADGRFAFGDLEPGTYLVTVSLLQYTTVTSSFNVSAGETDPPVHRLQLSRLFAQAPYTEQKSFDGYLACASAVGPSTTCVNDFTRVTGTQCLPTGECYCQGGCLRDYELAKQGGNIREYVSVLLPGWQSIIVETTWEPTSDLGEALGFTVSYFSRPDAVHRYGGVSGGNPIRLQLDVGVEHDSAQLGAGDTTILTENGTNELFTFFSAGSGSVVVNQGFRAFETVWYYSIPPEEWSFVAGDPRPF